MLVKATTNFSGTVTMTVGDTRELDGAVRSAAACPCAAPLGYTSPLVFHLREE